MGVGGTLKTVSTDVWGFLGRVHFRIKVRGWMLVLLLVILIFAAIQMVQTFS